MERNVFNLNISLFFFIFCRHLTQQGIKKLVEASRSEDVKKLIKEAVNVRNQISFSIYISRNICVNLLNDLSKFVLLMSLCLSIYIFFL